MNIVPHIYYTIKAEDVILPSDMKNRQEYGFTLKEIPAVAGYDAVDWRFIMNKQTKLKTTRELVGLLQNFCRKLHDVSDDYTALQYDRPTYKISMRRNAMVHMFDNNLGGVNVSNTIKLNATNDGIFDFIYNKANKIIYASNIRQILGMDLKYLRIYDFGECKHISFNRLSKYLNTETTPLYVYSINNDKDYGLEAYVKIIPDNQVVVNDKMCEIYPHVTGHIPAHMSLLFKNKTEPVKCAYSRHYRGRWH